MRRFESFTWLHVLIISALGTLLVAAAVHFLRPGSFTAESSLLISDRPDVTAGIAGAANAQAAAPPASSVERLKAIVVSRAVRERIVDKLQLAERARLSKAEVVRDLLNIATVKAIGEDGFTITVTMRGYANPRFAFFGYPFTYEEARQLSADIANAFLTELDGYVRELTIAHAADTRRFLEQEYRKLSGTLAETEDRLEDLRAQYELLDPETDAGRLADRIRTLEQARADAAAEADGAAGALRAAEAELDATEATRIASTVESRNPIISSLEQELTGLRIELATELAGGKTREHRDVQRIQASIDSVQEQIAELEDKVLKEVGEQINPLHDAAVQRVVEQRIQLASARARASELSRLLASARAEMARMPAVAREYVSIDRQQQLQAEQLAAVERALWAARVEEARARATEPFLTLDQAVPPIDRRGPATLLAGLIGFGALMLLQGLLIIDRRWFGG